MNDLLAAILSRLNFFMTAAMRWVLAPIALMPGWLSNALAACLTGVGLLIIFKYTSNQRAIGRVRDRIKADLLALRLFKDSLRVTSACQGRLLAAAMKSLLYAVVPLLVMIVPVSLVLSQLGLWYQFRPLAPGAPAVVTMKLNDRADISNLTIRMEPAAAAAVLNGPFRILSKKEVCWEIEGSQPGQHELVFDVDGRRFQKRLAVGDGFMRVSRLRPAWDWVDILLNPAERPFRPDSTVQSIHIDYERRDSWTSGADWWVGYFFVVSLLFAFVFKSKLGVRI